MREEVANDSAAAAIERANLVVAHSDRERPITVLTWGDLSAAIDRIGAAIQEVGVTVYGTYDLLEVFDPGIWKSTFRRPLFKPFSDSAPSRVSGLLTGALRP